MNSRLRSHKLVLLGETFVGKSSLVLRFVRGQFNESLESTVGAAYMTQTVMTMGKTIKFEIWDTAGQERYRSLAPMYYRGAKAAIVMYDITSKDSFECAKTWIEELKLKAQTVDVIAFVGNKIDLEKMRKVPTEEAEEYSKDNSLLFMEISVKDSVNVNEIFTEIAKQLPASFENTVPIDDSNDGFSIPKENDINSSQSGCVC